MEMEVDEVVDLDIYIHTHFPSTIRRLGSMLNIFYDRRQFEYNNIHYPSWGRDQEHYTARALGSQVVPSTVQDYQYILGYVVNLLVLLDNCQQQFRLNTRRPSRRSRFQPRTPALDHKNRFDIILTYQNKKLTDYTHLCLMEY